MVADYDQSSAIRRQNTTPARPNSKKPYGANSAKFTTRKKSVTVCQDVPNRGLTLFARRTAPTLSQNVPLRGLTLSDRPYEANSANLTTREKSVTTMRHKAMLGAHGGKNFHQGRAPLAGKGAE